MDDERTSGEAALADRYELGAVLGRGGMGTVHDATDLRLRRAVAVKILRPELAEQPRARRRFETEARAAARLAHPNVVTVYDSGEDGAVPFLVMERLPGGTFADEIAAGPVPVARVLDVARDVLSALDAAHRAGIIHRDIKPGNLLVDDDARVKVSDFGIAKTVDDVEQTQTMDLVATLAYLAPERLDGAPASERSDLYSLGVLLYEALSGRRPFREATPLLEMKAIERGTPDELVSLRPEVPRDLAAAIERAMARQPDDRFPSASAMAAALVPESDPELEPTVPITATSLADTEPVDREAASKNVTRPLPAHRAPAGGAEADERSGRTGARRARLVVGTAVVVVVAATAVGLAVRDNGQPSTPGTNTGPSAGAPTTTLPAALENALDRLEQEVGR